MKGRALLEISLVVHGAIREGVGLHVMSAQNMVYGARIVGCNKLLGPCAQAPQGSEVEIAILGARVPARKNKKIKTSRASPSRVVRVVWVCRLTLDTQQANRGHK